MKTLIFIVILLLPTFIFSQQNNNSEAENYLKKSNSKRKTANILAISGGGLLLTGIVVSASNQHNQEFLPTNLVVGGSLITLGVLSALTSIPFYISSNHNTKKYLKIVPSAKLIPKNELNHNTNYAVIGINLNF
ncbi:hypothetical protein [Frigoriflavimonas asaccharolytica]|uniref:Putative membrane protein YdfJ with MMPL/SSD domain n=1 Tax=Frigoriflavimonas asaccharolytica TaxID=2735899 RepID=A0A8J8G666_9FLAO|nr:hypothetical protein [Frigoriflavimonas asaccharolytica]NRS91746.1 putative membrane protein YdfJ with MMPL/SSD domain [Frigoriflavimonas asaccharolytica]